MDPLIHTLTHLHGDLATSRLLLHLLQETTTPGGRIYHAYRRTANALTHGINHVHHLLELLQEDDAPTRTPNERTPNACPTTCPRPSSPSSPSASSSPSPPSPPPSSPTSAATDTAERSPRQCLAYLPAPLLLLPASPPSSSSPTSPGTSPASSPSTSRPGGSSP